MRFGSVCSGIEAASVAFSPLGWKAAWLAEIEPFPSAVLAHHYPAVPNLGDMTKIAAMVRAGEIEAPDLLCGGTPCQSFSVAGLRKSLDDARGNLSLEFIRIANAIDDIRRNHGRKPAYILWENVPGVLSTKDNAFGAFLGGLCGRDAAIAQPAGGWTSAGVVAGPQRVVAWRVLDAQYFGLAQRRRRVFVLALGGAGGWACADALLPITNSLQGHPAPSRKAGKTAATTPSRSTAGGGLETDFDCDGGLIQSVSPTLDQRAGRSGANSFATSGGLVPVPHAAISPALKARDHKGVSSDGDGDGAILVPMLAHSLRGEGFDASEDGTGRGTPLVPVGVTIHGTDPTVQTVASYSDLAQCLRARTPGNIDNSSTTVVQQPVPVAFVQNSRDEVRLMGGDGSLVGALAAETGAKQQCYIAAPVAFPANLSATQHASAENISPSLGALNPTAVAFNMHKSGNEASSLGISEDRTDCLRAFEKSPFAVRMMVRRLTPEECEALQGFPTVSEKITIEACLDHQNQSVRVALKCLRWQNSALSAEESALTQPAKTAAVPSSTSPAHIAPLAALHVRMHSVDELLEIRSAGRLIWSASGAGQSKRSLPPTLTENSVQELARLLREAARTITAGKAASPPSISLSFPASSGATSAEKFGPETEVSASGAMNDQSKGMFTTSDLGLITMYSGSTVETLCCSALRAIAGCIPNKTLPETFSIELTVETPYTAIPWRNKPAADGPRYKALGNSWAVPCARWIGERIEAVEAIN